MPLEEIPKLGLGTWQNTLPRECVESIKIALETGYRHFDTAQIYRNERHVGKGVSEYNIKREDTILATKVWIENLSYEEVLETTEESLKRLNTEYIDILYIHWPAGDYNPEETLPAFEKLKKENKIRHIGLSNFTIDLIEEAKSVLDKSIFANQVEMHPLLQQEEMLEYLRKNDMYLIAYSPLARGRVFDVPEISEIAKKHNVSEAQVSLSWLIEKENVFTIPKATTEPHIKDNFRSKSLELDSEDIELIDSIEREERFVDMPFSPW